MSHMGKHDKFIVNSFQKTLWLSFVNIMHIIFTLTNKKHIIHWHHHPSLTIYNFLQFFKWLIQKIHYSWMFWATPAVPTNSIHINTKEHDAEWIHLHWTTLQRKYKAFHEEPKSLVNVHKSPCPVNLRKCLCEVTLYPWAILGVLAWPSLVGVSPEIMIGICHFIAFSLTPHSWKNSFKFLGNVPKCFKYDKKCFPTDSGD